MQPARMAQIRRDPASEVVSVSPRRDFRPAMGVVKLPEKVAARFSFFMRRQSPEVLGEKVRFSLWWRLPRGMRSALRLSTVQPAIRVRLSLCGSHCALYEHVRGKRAHPIYQRVCAQGRSRVRAAYQSHQ